MDVDKKTDKEVTLSIGAYDIVEIEKLYGPLVFMPLRVTMDVEECQWVIYRGYSGDDWREVARLPGQLEGDFIHQSVIPTHEYKTINFTHHDTPENAANVWAQRGWRVVAIMKFTMLLERPIGLTHPDD
jgi:hypothetical protein